VGKPAERMVVPCPGGQGACGAARGVLTLLPRVAGAGPDRLPAQVGGRGGGSRAGRPAEEVRMQRYGQAWAQALETARRLVWEFGAARVVAVGSLLHPERFHLGSKLVLVVWGLRADIFDRGGRGGRLPVAILDGDRLPEAAKARVQAEGVELARLSTAWP
jgi:hypothetical protein